MFKIIRTQEEIQRIRNWAEAAEVEVGDKYSIGVLAVLRWLCGDNDEAPDIVLILDEA